ncbi:MAG: GNAT family N-acetyltransferase, partial [Clostridia bacterium]|nr:GNAT family N-acetyltransferase [Clostridia bacterium]
VYPSKKYLKSYQEAFEEYNKHNVVTYAFDDISKVDVVKKYYNYRKGINLKPNRVAQTTYWLVDGDTFIGQIAIRHELNDALLKYGGHIGYGIRCSCWGKGYGIKMLNLALKKAKHMGLNKVLITCDNDNYASAKVIENNNGILENIVDNIIGGKPIQTRRYWIEL